MISWCLPVSERGYDFYIYVDFGNNQPLEHMQTFTARAFKNYQAITMPYSGQIS